MTIDFSNKFDKQLRKSPNKIKRAFKERLALFVKDQYHPLLNNHSLKGKLKPRRSIDITGDWRAWYRTEGKAILFVAIGTHSQLYK